MEKERTVQSMTREKYEALSVTVLKELAKSRGLKNVSALKKNEVIERMLEEDAREARESAREQEEKISGEESAQPKQENMNNAENTDQSADRERQIPQNNERRYNRNPEDAPSADLADLDSGIRAEGILEVMPDGYGFIRCANYLPGENDVYVSPSQIRRFRLKTGDIITGNTRIKTQQEKFSALLYLKTINGRTPAEASRRYNFEDMTPIFPNERMRMEREEKGVAMRIVDMVSPIGKGQRGMIVSPPKAGKTTLLKDIAKSILRNDKNMHLIILLIDERPEEVTDIKEAIVGENVEVIYSTFDELPEHHKRVSEMVIERAKRLVEHREDVTILLDSITRLARAYNLTVPPSGRTLSGGLDPAALHMPKRFFGAARNMREGGSLTILATALVDTGSKMDDVVYEEFKGTGNMELVLDRKLSEKRVFPAIDIQKSGTRREDLLLDREEQEAAYIMRKALNGMKSDEAVENILNMFVHTRNNREFVQTVIKKKYI
ncbi:MAG: transcription termination factor Rho [Hominisplanchenecus sp.]